eukprot:jgi/Hompol1/5076/HPOL_001298-RA
MQDSNANDMLNAASLLEEEEDLINQHLACVSANGFISRQERILITNVSRDDRDIDLYIDGLDKIVSQRLEMWGNLKASLTAFRSHIAQNSNRH